MDANDSSSIHHVNDDHQQQNSNSSVPVLAEVSVVVEPTATTPLATDTVAVVSESVVIATAIVATTTTPPVFVVVDEHESPSVEILQHQQQEQQPIVDMKDVWATSEGYTPLQDFMLMQHQHRTPYIDDTPETAADSQQQQPQQQQQDFIGGGAFFSDGTTGGTMYTSFPGAFYSNLGQPPHNNNNDVNDDDWGDDADDGDDDNYQDYNYLHNDDDDDDDDDVEGTTTTATITTTSSTSLYYDSNNIPDYRSVADSALSMLDRDYNNVISLGEQNMQHRVQQINLDGSCFDNVKSNGDEDDEEEDDLDDDPKSLEDVNVADMHQGDGTNSNPPSSQQHDAQQHTTVLETAIQQQQLNKHIDADAVRRAVQTIQLKNPKLEQSLRLWETSKQLLPLSRSQEPPSQQQQHPSMMYKQNNDCLAPRLHPIIPELPLTAFRKFSSNKAIQATANLTRSVCIAEALYRYNILQYHVNTEQTIRIHVIGCDHVEIGCHNVNNVADTFGNSVGYDIHRIRTIFGPIVRWMGAYAEAPSHICMELIGPNIPQSVATSTNTSPIDLLPSMKRSSSSSILMKGCLQSATLRCHSGTYEDILATNVDSMHDIGIPDLVIAFNAGIWGYQEWETTIRYLIQQQSRSVPFVITAYTLEEAEDDHDTIAEIVKQCQVDHKTVECVWDVEQNPFASNQEYKATTTAKNKSRRRENAAWQSWRL